MASAVVQCSLCGYFTPTIPSHISHLRLVHSKDPSFAALCPVYGCEENFRTFSGLNTHLYRHHRNALGLEVELEPTPCPSTEPAGGYTFGDNDPVINLHSDTEAEPCQETLQSVIEFDQKKYSAEFLLKLSEGRRLSQVAVQDVVDGCRTLCTQTAMYVQGVMKQKLQDLGINFDEFDGSKSVVLDPFEGGSC